MKNVARQIAVENGDKTYEGKECKVCGTVDKYTSSRACVCCANKKATAAYNALDPNTRSENYKALYHKNPEKYRQRSLDYYHDNKDNNEYKERNRPMWRHKSANRRTRMMRPLTEHFKDQLRDIYNQCPADMVVDHILPINGDTVCGLHVPWNLMYLTPTENSKKSNKVFQDLPSIEVFLGRELTVLAFPRS